MRKKRFAIAIATSGYGDFFFDGRFWRAVTSVKATNAAEAVRTYYSKTPAKGVAVWEKCMATDFSPAFDVLDAREMSSRLKS